MNIISHRNMHSQASAVCEILTEDAAVQKGFYTESQKHTFTNLTNFILVALLKNGPVCWYKTLIRIIVCDAAAVITL